MMTFRQKTILIATVLMGFVGTVFSQSVTLSVDQNTITLGESLSLQVKVAGSRDSTEPVISNMDNFEIESSGTSSQIQIINGTTTVSKVFQYMATPKKEGVFQIGPAVIEVSGVKFQSRAVNITVSKSPTHQKDAPYRVKAFVDNSSPFVHEQIVYVFQFLTRVQLANAKLDAPKFSDFWKEDLGKEREYQMTDQGISWSVTEVRYALFPNRAGILKIEPTVLSAAVVIRSNRQSLFDSFFDDPFFKGSGQTKRIRLETEPIEVNVKPLPKADQPMDFTGLVGEFKLQSELSKNSIAKGDSTTLTLTISGDGNLRDAKLPEILAKTSENRFKIYHDEPQLNLNVQGDRLFGDKTFKEAFVPIKIGSVSIPSFAFSYFNPKLSRYETIQSNAIDVTVLPGQNDESVNHGATPSTTPTKTMPLQIGNDIMPIKQSNDWLYVDELSRAKKFAIAATIFLLCLIYVIVWLIKNKRDGYSHDDQRKAKAYKQFKKNISSDDTKSTSIEYLSNVFRTYLGDKFGFDGPSLTSADIKARLSRTGLSANTLGDIETLVQECEVGIYSGSSAKAFDSKQVKEALKKTVEIVEKEVQR